MNSNQNPCSNTESATLPACQQLFGLDLLPGERLLEMSDVPFLYVIHKEKGPASESSGSSRPSSNLYLAAGENDELTPKQGRKRLYSGMVALTNLRWVFLHTEEILGSSEDGLETRQLKIDGPACVDVPIEQMDYFLASDRWCTVGCGKWRYQFNPKDASRLRELLHAVLVTGFGRRLARDRDQGLWSRLRRLNQWGIGLWVLDPDSTPPTDQEREWGESLLRNAESIPDKIMAPAFERMQRRHTLYLVLSIIALLVTVVKFIAICAGMKSD